MPTLRDECAAQIDAWPRPCLLAMGDALDNTLGPYGDYEVVEGTVSPFVGRCESVTWLGIPHRSDWEPGDRVKLLVSPSGHKTAFDAVMRKQAQMDKEMSRQFAEMEATAKDRRIAELEDVVRYFEGYAEGMHDMRAALVARRILSKEATDGRDGDPA